MKTSIVLLLALCAFSCHCVSAGGGKCKEELKEVFKELNKIYDDGTAPQCTTDFALARFKNTDGEDVQKDKEIMKTFINWVKSQDKDTQGKIMTCISDMTDAAMKRVGDKLSQECKNKMELLKKMTKRIR